MAESKQNRISASRRIKMRKAKNKKGAAVTSRSVNSDELLRPPLFRQMERRNGQIYYENGLSLTSAGTIGYYRFSANGMFDPNVTGTGHQPMGFDTMMEYFDQYVVVRSRIKVRFTNATGEALARIGGIKLADDTASPSEQEFVENGLGRTQLFGGDFSVVPGKWSMGEINLGCDVMEYFGRHEDEKQFLNDVDMHGTATTNPTEQVYFLLAVWNHNGAVAVSVKFDVIISYDAIYYEPRRHAVSEELPRTAQAHKQAKGALGLKEATEVVRVQGTTPVATPNQPSDKGWSLPWPK